MSYEVQASPHTQPAAVVTIGRYNAPGEAVQRANEYARRNPLSACYVFCWVTPKTRLLVHHTLNA